MAYDIILNVLFALYIMFKYDRLWHFHSVYVYEWLNVVVGQLTKGSSLQ